MNEVATLPQKNLWQKCWWSCERVVQVFFRQMVYRVYRDILPELVCEPYIILSSVRSYLIFPIDFNKKEPNKPGKYYRLQGVETLWPNNFYPMNFYYARRTLFADVLAMPCIFWHLT